MKILFATLAVLFVGAAWAFPPSLEYFGPPLTGVVARGESAYLPPYLSYNAVGVYSLPAAQFQWKFQGTNIPGATNPLATSFGIYSYLRLQIDNVQPSNAGLYTLVASNADGVSIMTNWLQVEPLIIYGLYSEEVQSGTEFMLNAY